MNRIGLVDDELDNYHTNVFLELMRGRLKSRGFDAAGCLALKEEAGREWAGKNSVPYFSDPKELSAACDFFMVMAPSTAGTHLELCRKIVPFGKPVFVDKTFAPDLKTAMEIFSLADRHKAALESYSSLRFTAVQKRAREIGIDGIRHMVAYGAGGKLEEYLVHPLEMIVSVMGPQAERVMRRGSGSETQVLVDFSKGRTAVVNVYLKTETPFAAVLNTPKVTEFVRVDLNDLFADALSATLDFFEAGRPLVPREETLAIRKIMDAALGAQAASGWLSL